MRKQSALRSANMSRLSVSNTPPPVQSHSASAKHPSLPVPHTPTQSPTPPRRSPSPPLIPPPKRPSLSHTLQSTSPPCKKTKAAVFESPLTQDDDEEHEPQTRTSPRKGLKAAAGSATASKAKISMLKRRRVKSPAGSEGESDEEHAHQVRRSPRKGAKTASATKAKTAQCAPKKRRGRK